MTLIGFHFKKMLAEKKKAPAGKINVQSNVVFKDLKEAKVNLGSEKQKGVEINFNFTAKYTPDHGSIDLEGAVVYIGDADVVSKILSSEGKEMPDNVREEVFNFLLAKCNIQALVLERDMGLPSHLPMPKLETKKAA